MHHFGKATNNPLSSSLAISLTARGYILVTTMLMAILVMVIGVGASALSITNASISRNVRANANTRYLAEAATDAAIGFIREETSGHAYDGSTIASTLIPEAERLNLSGIVPSCPSFNGKPCVDIDVNLLSPSRLDLIEVRSTILDRNQEAEYSVMAIVQLRQDAVPYDVETAIASDGYVKLNGAVDLRGVMADDSDDVFLHGNGGYQLSHDTKLPHNPETGQLAVTSGDTPSICEGGSLLTSCQTIADISIDLLTFDEVVAEVSGAPLFPPPHDNTANNLSQLENRCRNGDVVRYYGNSIADVTLEECIVVVLNDLDIEGHTVVLPDTILLAGGAIHVRDSVSFTGNNVLAARADGASGNLGITINSSNVSADNLLIVSAGTTDISADVVAGVYSEGPVTLNGDLLGFIWSHDNIILNGTVGASASIINSLLPTTSSYSFDAVISRN